MQQLTDDEAMAVTEVHAGTEVFDAFTSQLREALIEQRWAEAFEVVNHMSDVALRMASVIEKLTVCIVSRGLVGDDDG